MTKLNLEIIKSYGFKERTYKPDWDDCALVVTLPNGIELETLTVCFNQPTESDSLEGYDAHIYIETKEELDILISQTYEEVMLSIHEKNPDFNIEDYI